MGKYLIFGFDFINDQLRIGNMDKILFKGTCNLCHDTNILYVYQLKSIKKLF